MIPLQVVTILFLAVAAPCVVLVRDLVRQAIVLGFYGFGLVVLFTLFQAPDVALSELVVSGIAYPLVLVVSIARVHGSRRRK